MEIKKEEVGGENAEISRNDFTTNSYLGHLTVIVVGLREVGTRDSNVIHHSAQCLMDILT